MLRGLLTFFTGIAILIVLTFINGILNLIIAGIFMAVGIQIENSTIFTLISYFKSILFISIPYALITTYFIYDTISKVETDRYGIIGGPIASGMLCWLFNFWSLPYVLYAKIWPVKYVELPEPNLGKKDKFIIGWVLGLIIEVICYIVFMPKNLM